MDSERVNDHLKKYKKLVTKPKAPANKPDRTMKEMKYFSKTAFQLCEYSRSLFAESDSEVEQINANY